MPYCNSKFEFSNKKNTVKKSIKYEHEKKFGSIFEVRLGTSNSVNLIMEKLKNDLSDCQIVFVSCH